MPESIIDIITAFVSVIALIIAGLGTKNNAKSLEYTAKSFEGMGKTEELRLLEGIYRDISQKFKRT